MDEFYGYQKITSNSISIKLFVLNEAVTRFYAIYFIGIKWYDCLIMIPIFLYSVFGKSLPNVLALGKMKFYLYHQFHIQPPL